MSSTSSRLAADSRALRARAPGIIAGRRDAEHTAHDPHRIVGAAIFDEAESHFCLPKIYHSRLHSGQNGLMGMLLRYPYEVRDAAEYFDDIQDVKITKDMLDLAKHIVETKAGHFEPAKFQDHYKSALCKNCWRRNKRASQLRRPKRPPQQRLQPDGRAARQYQRRTAHARGKTGEGRQEIEISEARGQAQGKLTAMTMIRRYNRFWTVEDDHLLLELRAAGRSSVFIGAALKRSAQAIDKRSSTLKARAQLAEDVAVDAKKE